MGPMLPISRLNFVPSPSYTRQRSSVPSITMTSRILQRWRAVRKVIFSLLLWRPARQRVHSHRLQQDPGRLFRSGLHSKHGLAVGCVNARSVGNKATTLCSTIVEDHLDVLVIVKTWHERFGSTTLQRVIPPGYQCIDAARPIAPGVAMNTVEFQNHGGLAFIHRDNVKFQKRVFDINVTTFEYLYGYATTSCGQFMLLAIYRLGSQAVAVTVYDDLSAVFDHSWRKADSMPVSWKIAGHYQTCHFSPNYCTRSFRSVFRPSLTVTDWCLRRSPHIDDSTAQRPQWRRWSTSCCFWQTADRRQLSVCST